ncbi:MAG: tetratricopeptide repeat protein, partial [Humidesulfovibrio sp.]|nr:tetratricopeptide repeat protein [Humidesulfovibrio sp.]
SLWILEAACATPDLRVAVLGQRVALRRNAGAFDALLHQLDSQGRLYLDQGFVPQAALDMVLASPVVPCLPLPYLLHTGSSGLQLLAAAHGKPCLVPDYGLMASRAVDAGLGPVFAHGQCASFRRGLDRLLAPGAAQAYASALARFMEFFTPEATFRALDHGFGLAFGPAPLPPWTEAPSLAGLPARAAQAAYSAGDPDTAVEELDAALRRDPEHHGLGFLKALALSAAGRADEATAQMALLKERGQAQIDCAFHLARLERFLPVLLSALEKPAQATERDAWLLRCLDAQLGLLLDHLQPAELQSSRDLVEPLRTLGDEAVRSKRLEMACKAYARAVECDPERSDSRLNLSDVLRYLGRMAESLAMLDELAARSPEEPGLACKRGQVYVEQGRLEDAVAEFHRELARGPSTFADMAEGHLARVLKRLGDGAADS